MTQHFLCCVSLKGVGGGEIWRALIGRPLYGAILSSPSSHLPRVQNHKRELSEKIFRNHNQRQLLGSI